MVSLVPDFQFTLNWAFVPRKTGQVNVALFSRIPNYAEDQPALPEQPKHLDRQIRASVVLCFTKCREPEKAPDRLCLNSGLQERVVKEEY